MEETHHKPQTPSDDDDSQFIEVRSFRWSEWRRWVYLCLSVLSLGLLPLVAFWYPRLWLSLNMRPCFPALATHVFVRDTRDEMDYGVICGVEHADVSPELAVRFTQASNKASLLMPGGAPDETAVSAADDINLVHEKTAGMKYFCYKQLRYIFNPSSLQFEKIRALDRDVAVGWFLSEAAPLSNEDAGNRERVYGPNNTVVPVNPVWKLILLECVNPFYIFQVFSVALWTAEAYYYYAICIVIISVVSILVSAYETHSQEVSIHQLSRMSSRVLVCRQGESDLREMDTESLVPGDIVSIPSDMSVLTFDAVLISGSCVVNESMLTGESVPVTKSSLTAEYGPDEQFSVDAHKRHTLFSGTHLVQSRGFGNHRIRAVVLRTGFMTSKGELIRSILFPRPVSFQFYLDAIKFILVLSVLAAVGTLYSIAILRYYQNSAWEQLLLALDIVTICVPPALPAALTISVVYAQSRLKHLQIFCITPSRINVAGRINLVCYDKTGTITEEGLDVLGVVPYSGENAHLDGGGMVSTMGQVTRHHPLLGVALGSSHALNVIAGEVTGDPLDVKMLQFTEWDLDDTEAGVIVSPPSEQQSALKTNSVHQKKLYPFASEMQRMSIVAEVHWTPSGQRQLHVFSKGSPEAIRALCKLSSVPANLEEVVQSFGDRGLRVIALAAKSLSPSQDYHTMQRTEIESDLYLLGLLVMENRVKPESIQTINGLNQVEVRQVMITGDNISTATSVARTCGLIGDGDQLIRVEANCDGQGEPASVHFTSVSSIPPPRRTAAEAQDETEIDLDYHFSMTGPTFDILLKYFPNLLTQMLLNGTVFARMKPRQKSALVGLFNQLGFTVGYCGDGSNDCGALKNADIGISLSEAEASIAAPFTSKKTDISCVPRVIKEGRCSLATSFAMLKYMVLYSMIQFTSVVILYSVNSNLGDTQFLYIDLFIITSVALVMSRTGPAEELVVKRPSQSLLSTNILLSVFLQIMLMASFQLLAFGLVRSQPWYESLSYKGHFELVTFETTAVFCISVFQYIVAALVFSKGKPYRAPIYSNLWYVVCVGVLIVVNSLIVMQTPDWLLSLFELIALPSTPFKVTIFVLVIVNVAIAYFTEYVLDKSRLSSGLEKERPKHQQLCDTLSAYSFWPPKDTSIHRDIPLDGALKLSSLS